MSRRLEDHLYPKGSLGDSTLTPSVLDSDGAAVGYESSKRKTSEVTVVNVGDSANSNTGDPLRTAFIKVNNFIEASYWTNETVARDMDWMERRLDSDELLIADHTKRLDSDQKEIQRLKTEFNELFDSEYRKNADWFAYAQQKFDSDQAALQSIRTDVNNLLDSEYVKNREKFAEIDARLDSDEIAIQSLSQEVFTNIALEIYDSAGTKLKTIYGKSTTP